MIELIRTNDLVLISALKAALAAEGLDFFEFDGPVASAYGGIDSIPRRLMVTAESFDAAEEIARVLCPEYFE